MADTPMGSIALCIDNVWTRGFTYLIGAKGSSSKETEEAMKTMTDSIKKSALDAVSNGWKIIPVKPSNKVPHFDLVKHGHLDATDDISLIGFWFDLHSNINYGINCQASGLVVLDIDFRNGGKVQDWMLETRTVSTGDGLHLYYSANADARFVGNLGDGIDVKHRGFVVGASSVHSNGRIYTVTNDVPVAALNKEMLKKVTR